MSKYTTQLRNVINSGYDLGLKNYPIFDEKYRPILNAKILQHYYMCEIGFESVEMFKFALNREMNEIMPLFNQYYKSELVEFNPLYNIDTTETYTHKIDNKNNNSQNSKSDSNSLSESTGSGASGDKSVFSDTPNSIITPEQINSELYATNVTVGATTNATASNGKMDNNTVVDITGINTGEMLEEYTRKVIGSSAGLAFSTAIKKWRDIMINVDMLVIEKLDGLFMQVW